MDLKTALPSVVGGPVDQRREVKGLFDDLGDEVGQVLLGEPLVETLVRVVAAGFGSRF